MAKTNKSIASVAFRVPNDEAGNRWIEQSREYINRDRFAQIATRPRGGTLMDGHNYHRKGCKWFGVYLRESDAEREANWRDIQQWQDYGKNRAESDLRWKCERIAGQLQTASEELEWTHGELVKANDEVRGSVRAVEHWQTATLAAFIIGGVIGYFI